jgi:CheY-like chemotaxis protein
VAEDGTIAELPKRVAVIDDDELVRNLVSNYCRSIGILEIEAFQTGEDLWTALLAGKEFDLIILDWKLPGLSGVGLFNRLRSSEDHKMLPMLVISGFLIQNDFALLEEFPCTSLLEKPFTKVLLERKILDLVQESTWYREKSKLIGELLQHIKDKDSAGIRGLLSVCTKSPKPIPLAILIAKRLREANLLVEAKSFLHIALERDASSVSAMTEMAKVLFLMGKISEARDVLRISNRISPENISRLCFLGEIELNLQEPDAARRYFESALEIDYQDGTALAGATLAKSISEHFINYSKDSIPTNFASLLNMVAINKVRSGHFADGIKQYIAAIAFLRSDLAIAKISFNLGLGFLRWEKPELAQKWFEKSSALSYGKFTRAENYLPKLDKKGQRNSKIVVGMPQNFTEEGDLSEGEADGPPLLEII